MSVFYNRVNKIIDFLEGIDDVKHDSNVSTSCTTTAPSNINVSKSNINVTVNNNFKPSSGSKAEQIMNTLSKLNIKIDNVYTHEPIETSENHLKIASNIASNIKIAKNLLLKLRRVTEKTQYLIIYDAKKSDLNLKILGHYLGVGGNLRFGDCNETLQMEKGCITPLALIFDQKKVVEVIIDEDLMSSEYIGVHPGTNSATIGISPSDLEKYIYVNNSKEIKKNEYKSIYW